eukprot:7746646-Pyramimonas_sp.AAC.1
MNACPFCRCTSSDCHARYANTTLDSIPRARKTKDSYDRQCSQRSKVRAIQTCGQQAAVMKQGRLTPMEGKGYWGGTLLADVPALQLLAGDRLEPFD